MAKRRPRQNEISSVIAAVVVSPRQRLWPATRWRRHLAVLGSLLLLIILFFSNSFFSGMTLDNRYIIEEYYRSLTHQDPSLDLISARQIGTIFSNDYWAPKGISGLYRPLTTLSYWLDYAVLNRKGAKHDSNFNPILGSDGKPIPASTYAAMTWKEYSEAPGLLPTFSYHVINLLMHWINASLLYFICLAMLKRFWPSACTAVLFATHPIVTESVTNIIGRADLFAGFTILAGLLLYMRSTVARGYWRAPWLIGLTLVIAFGLFSKESSIAVGVIVPLYWLVFCCPWSREKFAAGVGNEMLVWSIMLIPLAGMMAARHYVFSHSTPAEEPFLDNPIRGIHSVQALGLASFDQQLHEHPVLGVSVIECKLTAVKVLGKLIGLLVWPLRLSSDYSYSEIPNFSWTLRRWEDWQALIALAFFVGVGLFTRRLWKRGNRPAVFWVGFFVLTALPTANLIYAIGSIMAERFMYVPLAGFAALLVMAGFALAERFRERLPYFTASQIATTVFALLSCLYGTRTFLRNFVWRNDESLWRDALAHSPRSFRSYQSLAFALYERPDAQSYLDEMIRLDQIGRTIVDDLPDHLNSARLYLHLGMYLSIKGDTLLTHNPDGSMTMTDGARHCFEQAVETLVKGSGVDRAFDEQIKRRQQLRGDAPEKIADMGLAPIYGILGMAQARLGHVDDALKSIQYQRQIDPVDIDSYRKEAIVCVDSGRNDLAAVSLLQGLLIDSSQTPFWKLLAQIYSKLPGGNDALAQVDNQPRINEQNPLVRQHLIAAYSRFIRDLRRAHRPDLARIMHDNAIRNFGLPAGLLDPLLIEPIDICTPDGIQADQVDPSVPPIG